MKIINEEKGYTTSIILLIMIIPLILLLTITVEEYNHEVDSTVKNLQSKKMKSTAEDIENSIIISTKESLHNITLDAMIKKKALTNSRQSLKQAIQSRINLYKNSHFKDSIIVDATIRDVKASDDPFKIEIHYSLTVTSNNSRISKDIKREVEITDKNYPVYDPLPTLKTGSAFTNDYVAYGYNLYNYINLENASVYINSIQPITIRKCPYDDYAQHGNDNKTILNCLNNHYYHNSHDGLCLLCRLENKTSCNDYGFETFIQPRIKTVNAPASIDHVLLNSRNTQYSGENITIDNNTVLYLDNGHKAKYGL